MASLMRYDPFGEVFDDFLKGFFVRPVGFENQAAANGRIKIDVAEKDNAYTVLAEIPGVKKEDIQVSIDGDEVTISAENRAEREVKDGERFVHRERYYGKVMRSFRLASEIDQSGANAKYADGVLELRLPKKAATAGRQLTIQ